MTNPEVEAWHILLLLRHAQAAQPDAEGPTWPDHERPLTSRGSRDAGHIAERLATEGPVPDLVLCSDALRTRQTADFVVSALQADGHHPAVRAVPDLYEASVHRVLHLVADVAEDVGTVLVVGHQPTMSATVAALTGRHGSMPPAGLAVLEVDGAWAGVAAGSGRLLGVRTPGA